MSLAVLGLLIVQAAVLLLPGGVVAVAAGVRGGVALAVAPLLTYGLATAASTAAGVLDLPWGAGLLAAEAVGLALLLRLARGRRTEQAAPRRPIPRRDVAAAVGVLAGGLFAMGVLVAGMGDLSRPSQYWDYTFHANATRVIADTGDVAPSALRVVNDWEAGSFYYPNAYHAVAAVVRDLTGASVFEVLNTQVLLIPLLAGLGLAVLLRQLGASAVVTAAAPVLLAGFTSFPYDMLWRGPLLPWATGLALLPAFLLLVRRLLVRRLVVRRLRRPVEAVVTGLAGAALIGLHPSVALSGGLLAGLLLLQPSARAARLDRRTWALLGGAAVLSGLLAATGILGAVRTGSGVASVIDWRAVETPGQAVGDLLTLNHGLDAPQFGLAALLLLGLLTLRSARPLWWLAAGSGVAGTLFVLAAAADHPLTEALTRPWWNDRWRFAALAVLGFAPIAAHGLERAALALSRWAGQLSPRLRAGRPAPRPAATAVGLLILLAIASQGLYAGHNAQRLASSYQSDRYVDAAELAAMSWLGPRVGPGETVMNDPSDGSAYLLAVAGARPLFGHQVPTDALATVGPTQRLLLTRFRCLDTDPQVRAAIERLDIRYVLLGAGFVRDGRQRTPGLEAPLPSRSLELVHTVDDVRVYRVDLQAPAATPAPGCGPGTGEAPPD